MIRFKRKKLLFTSLAALTLILTGCNVNSSSTPNYLTNTALHAVGDADTLTALLADANQTKSGGWDFNTIGMESGDLAAPSASETQSSREYTDTNTQVEGVMESDIIKTDGYFIYYAARYENRIRVMEVLDDHSITLGETIDLGNVYTEALYLTEDYLVVIGYSYETIDSSCGIAEDDTEVRNCVSMYWYSPSGTALFIDRDTLETVYELKTDSYFMDHRLIEERNLEDVVTSTSLFLVGHKYMYYGTEDFRPTFTENPGSILEQVEKVDYSSIYYFEETPAYSMTVLTGIRINSDPSLIEYNAAAYLGANDYYKQMYVSNNALYLTNTTYHYTENISWSTMTITQFDIDTTLATLTYRAGTILEGTSLNQFSMDEYDGYLRVATTNRMTTYSGAIYWWESSFSSTITNHLYVLRVDAESDHFIQVGHLSEGLGKPNESIQSVRFDTNTAYVVTFLRTDPLYIIDLSDPTTPEITGEIEQLGYDTYQHPWGTNQLVGLGYSADENGSITGINLKAYSTASGSASVLQTMDVVAFDWDNSNWSYGYSEALWNSRAILVDVEKGIFAFAVQFYTYGYREVPTDPNSSETGDSTPWSSSDNSTYTEWFYEYYSYYYIFKIDFAQGANTISEPIVIEHPTSEYYLGTVERGILIDDYIYTISNNLVITYSLASDAIVEPNLILA